MVAQILIFFVYGLIKRDSDEFQHVKIKSFTAY